MWSLKAAVPLAAVAVAAVTLGACRNGAAGNAAVADTGSVAAQAAAAPLPPGGAPAEAAKAADSPIDLNAIGHDEGRATAPVSVVEFFDFGCPYCARFGEQVWPTLQKEYVQTGKVRWKTVPFVMGMFRNGAEAARAGECAAAQGKPAFRSMARRLFARQKEWKASADPAALFGRYASELHLDAGAFAACYRTDAEHARVEAANKVAAQLGVHATPTFFVNGARVEGALPLSDFRMVLQQAGAR